MKHKKIFKKLSKNKIGKGLVSLITIIVLLSSILATSLLYQSNITGFVVSETIISDEGTPIQITTVNDIKELNQLNEGWYQIVNGYVYYLEHFDSFVPLYIKVINLEQQNGILGVEEDREVIFYKDISLSQGQEIVEEEKEESTQNQVTGQVTGLERVSGF